MKTRQVLLIYGVILLFSLACMQFAQTDLQEENKAEAKVPSLLRLDLLFQAKSPMAPPVRNIFSPHRSGSRSGLPGNYQFDPGMSESESEAEDQEAMEDYIAQIELRYIGYIWSEKKAVALIIFEGETMAVSNGEIIAEDVRIIKITPAEIEFIGPDSEAKKVLLEGEER